MAFRAATTPHTMLETEKFQVDHAFTFSFNEKWDKLLKRSIDQGLDVCYEYAESFRIIAIGLSAYFVMSGLAKLVEAVKDPSSSGEKEKKSNKDKSTNYKGKSKDNSSKYRASKTLSSTTTTTPPDPTIDTSSKEEFFDASTTSSSSNPHISANEDISTKL